MNLLSTCISPLLFILFLTNHGQAAHPKAAWQTGQLELWNKTILAGELSYNWGAEMVSVRQADGRVRTFSANQASHFSWFDYSVHRQRHFVSLEKALDKERSSQVFYELCMDGPLAVVRRMRKPNGLLKRWFRHPALLTDQPAIAQDISLFEYFVYDAGRLLSIDRFYSDIYQPLMTSYKQELYQYVQTHNINDHLLPGRLIVINRYNWLVQHDTKAASTKDPAGALK